MATLRSDAARGRSSQAPGDWLAWAVTAGCVALVAAGWSQREEQYIAPDHGPGYALGIVGATAMASILLYSARKRARWLRRRGAMKHWMQAHLAMGIGGPLAILFHCNFQLGATNSNIALFTMLAVAGSGIVGRFLYRQIHRGLQGRQLEMSELWKEAQDRLGPVAELRASQRELVSELEDLARWTRAQLGQLLLPLRLRRRVARARSVARLVLADAASRAQVESYLEALTRTARFALCERLFRYWHALHVPLFAMLVATVVAHVVAVHMY